MKRLRKDGGKLSAPFQLKNKHSLTRINKLEQRMEFLRNTVNNLSKRVASLNQTRCTQKNYIKRLQVKHCSQARMLERVKSLGSSNLVRRIKFVVSNFQRFKFMFGEGKRYGNRHVMYLTNNQRSKLLRLLKTDIRNWKRRW